jgi:UDP-GlcNAc3NAcA epimerase
MTLNLRVLIKNMTKTDFTGQAKEIKIITVIGARPQFIKAATVNRAIEDHNCKGHTPKIEEILMHTGQHYDYGMSDVFFEEMQIPHPMKNLNINSCDHAEMTGRMLIALEAELKAIRPDWVLIYGDTNSTLAGALSASKLHIPVAHVEAGLRSYNRRMPEEINRVLTDHISTLLFAPNETAMANLRKEGISNGVSKVGDVMYDGYLFLQQMAPDHSTVLQELGLQPKSYFLATIHRQENTDDYNRLSSIFKAFDAIAEEKCPLVILLHPRTREALNHFKIKIISNSHIRLIEPVGYMDMIQLEANARIIFTDSGGVQKEAYFAGIPCVTLRDETEWVETVECGANLLTGADVPTIVEAYEKALTIEVQLKNGIYGDGHAAEKIVATLIKNTE